MNCKLISFNKIISNFLINSNDVSLYRQKITGFENKSHESHI